MSIMTTLVVEKTGTRTITPKPFLKWVGGKRQLISEILQRSPNSFNNYFEPFLGGGAVFFSISHSRAIIGDINEELINSYKTIKSDVRELIKLLKRYKILHNKDFFYKIRNVNPKNISRVERVARLIYLNKTCFNGLYRVNSKGEFNVPFGSYKNPLICDEENLIAVHHKLKKTKIIHANYSTITKTTSKNDFVYFDPPYEPVSSSSNFVNYSKNGFTQENQRELSELYSELTKRGVYCMLSNSSAPLIWDLYREYNINKVKAARTVNSKANGRGKIEELIITNY